MTWIKTTSADEADGQLLRNYQELRRLYPAEYSADLPAALRRDGGAGDSVVAAHSLIPDAMRHALAAYGVLLAPDLPLTRRQHEMIATLVSALNRCFY